MKRLALCLLGGLALVLALHVEPAEAGWPERGDRNAQRFARTRSWHRDYYHTATGYPIPLVVPPTAHMQVSWGWGVAQSATHPIHHRYQRAYPGDFYGGSGTTGYATPRWPSHTDQFGVYYIRGPW